MENARVAQAARQGRDGDQLRPQQGRALPPEGGALLRHRRAAAPGGPDRDRPQQAAARQSRRLHAARPRDRVLATWRRTPRPDPGEEREALKLAAQQRFATISEDIHAISPAPARLLALRARRRVRGAGRQGPDRRREHGPRHAGPPLVRRPAPGRRGQGGRHDRAETRTYATITIQNYFRMYEKLAGMTGTAETEATEFNEIYRLAVAGDPDQQALHPASTRTTRSSRRAATSTTRSSGRSRRPTSAASRSSSARRASRPRRCSRRMLKRAEHHPHGPQRQVPPAGGRDRLAGRACAARSRSRPTWPAAAPTSNWAKA